MNIFNVTDYSKLINKACKFRFFQNQWCSGRTFIFLILSICITYYFFNLSSPFLIPPIDDAAIVMRYLENFKLGYFYRYNIEDGPVFGISGFWYGFFSGMLSWMGLTPIWSMMTASMIGSILFFYTLFEVLYVVSGSLMVSVLGVLVFSSASFFLPQSLFLGLETPLHLWFVASTILFFLAKREKIFYVFCALTVVSKLDASFIVLGLVFLNIARAYLDNQAFKSVINGLTYFGIPLIVWVIFSTYLFGSPIPQTFIAKYYFHGKAPKTSWFPFLETMLQNPSQKLSLILILGLTFASSIYFILKKRYFQASNVFLILGLGTLALYYFYNPGEKMLWYYPLPEFLLLMAAISASLELFEMRATRINTFFSTVSLLIIGVIVYLQYPLQNSVFVNFRQLSGMHEKERMEMGAMANSIAPESGAVLWTSHGFPAYMFKGYVIDYSGLNFPKIKVARDLIDKNDAHSLDFLRKTGYGENPGQNVNILLIKEFSANVFTRHELFTQNIQKEIPMRLAGSFYIFDMMNFPALRLFVRDDDNPELNIVIPKNDISIIKNNDRSSISPLSIQAERVEIELPKNASRLIFGIGQKNHPFSIVLSNQDDDRKIGECFVAAPKSPTTPPGTQECRFDFKRGLKKVTIVGPGEDFMMYEPVATILLSGS